MAYPVEKLSQNAAEEGNYPVKFSFYDEDNAVVIPNAGTVTWILTGPDGATINSGSVDSAAEMIVLLEGSDLTIGASPTSHRKVGGKDVPLYRRQLAISGEINTTIGTNIPVNKEYVFDIEGLVGIS